MNKRAVFVICPLLLAVPSFAQQQRQQPPQQVDQWHLQHHPFDNPNLPTEQRIDNLLSLMTIDEKIDCLGTQTGVPRLGVPNIGSSEGIHGVVQREARFGRQPITTTQFPQPPGMGESWDPNMVQAAANVEGFEARFITQTPKYDRQVLMLWGPQSDLDRDPRWGRSEEVYGEDPLFNGTMATAFVHGLQGDNPKYWQSAALLKHFLANENENLRNSSSSNFDERLFWEYYSVPFRMAFLDGGAKAVMASYNAWNGTTMEVNPILRSIVIDKWGVDVVSSDGGAVKLLVSPRHLFPNQEAAVVACLKAGINQYLDSYKDELHAALKDGSITQADLDNALRRKFRITIKLGLLDPPNIVPYTSIKDSPEPWNTDKDRNVSRKMALESVVLLKNEKNFLPLDKKTIKSIAVIGPLANVVHWDWYGGTPPYAVTPLKGIQDEVGPNVKVNYAAYDTPDGETEAMKAASESDVAVVVVGNNPTCGDQAHDWYNSPTEGGGITLPMYRSQRWARGSGPRNHRSVPGTNHQAGLHQEPEDGSDAHLQLSVRYQLDGGPCAGDSAHGAVIAGRRNGTGAGPVWRLQPRRPSCGDLAEIGRPASAKDGLRHPRWLYLHVLQRRAALSIRIRPELYDFQNLKHQDKLAAVSQRWKCDGERGRDKYRQPQWRRSGTALREVSALRSRTSARRIGRLPASDGRRWTNEDSGDSAACFATGVLGYQVQCVPR